VSRPPGFRARLAVAAAVGVGGRREDVGGERVAFGSRCECVGGIAGVSGPLDARRSIVPDRPASARVPAMLGVGHPVAVPPAAAAATPTPSAAPAAPLAAILAVSLATFAAGG
jgi:hypothetical protein